MIEVSEITIQEFEEKIYNTYITLFPKEEQREWKKVTNSYNEGIEKFYKISLNNNIIGFFMLEKLEDLPYYLDYFAIYKEYQNKGYGTKSLEKLLKDIIKEAGLIAEIEKINDEDITTKRRFKFYENLGFTKVDRDYLLYDVLYNPIIYYKENNKDKIDDIFFKYYEFNVGIENIKKHCSIIK